MPFTEPIEAETINAITAGPDRPLLDSLNRLHNALGGLSKDVEAHVTGLSFVLRPDQSEAGAVEVTDLTPQWGRSSAVEEVESAIDRVNHLAMLLTSATARLDL